MPSWLQSYTITAFAVVLVICGFFALAAVTDLRMKPPPSSQAVLRERERTFETEPLPGASDDVPAAPPSPPSEEPGPAEVLDESPSTEEVVDDGFSSFHAGLQLFGGEVSEERARTLYQIRQERQQGVRP